MENEEITRDKIIALLKSKKFAVLSTVDEGQPYASLVAFKEGPTLDLILFATERKTRKFKNLTVNNRVALLVENSTNSGSDVSQAMAVTATGAVEIAGEQEREAISSLYLMKHPYLEDFIKSPTSAFIKVRVEQYFLVENFQTVKTLNLI
jgi:heme iron utilization protein